jgi:hypothetical protein
MKTVLSVALLLLALTVTDAAAKANPQLAGALLGAGAATLVGPVTTLTAPVVAIAAGLAASGAAGPI